jgi:hypothetical protein
LGQLILEYSPAANFLASLDTNQKQEPKVFFGGSPLRIFGFCDCAIKQSPPVEGRCERP